MSDGFLVLSRRPDEKITIKVPPSSEEQTIEVKCLQPNGKQSRLGFSAEKHINIVRNELLERDPEAKAV